jgi:CubicO group peptidase (beta-lactamase class C family)
VLVTALDVVAGWPVETAAVAVLDRSGIVDSIGPDDVALPWASVTKPLTALSVLVAVDAGTVGLDDAVGPPGSTLRHLLAHASGVSFGDRTVLAQPGRRRIYSNYGIELAAKHVAERAGRPFDEHLAETVLGPLGMAGTELAGTPAAGARGPLRDLAALGRELLAPTLVPDLVAEATKVAFPGLSGILPGFGRQDPNDWGLGFEIRDSKRPHWTGAANSPDTFGHFGQSGTFLWVDPEAGLACACLTDRAFGDWAARCWPELSDRALASRPG